MAFINSAVDGFHISNI